MSEQGGTGGDGGSGGEGGQNTPAWTDGMDEGQAAFVSNKGWTSAADAVRGYQELESFRGVPADRLLKLPDAATAEAKDWDHVYTALGRPENVDGYGDLTLPEGATMHEGRMTAFKQKAFELGLNTNQVAALANWDAEFVMGVEKDADGQSQLRAQEDIAAMRKEWGTAFDRKVASMDAGQAAFGMTGDEVVAMKKAFGTKRTMELLANIGGRIGEDSLDLDRDGDTTFKGGMTPAEAEQALKGLRMDDAFMTKYKAGNPDALAQYDRLMRLKHGS